MNMMFISFLPLSRLEAQALGGSCLFIPKKHGDTMQVLHPAEAFAMFCGAGGFGSGLRMAVGHGAGR